MVTTSSRAWLDIRPRESRLRAARAEVRFVAGGPISSLPPRAARRRQGQGYLDARRRELASCLVAAGLLDEILLALVPVLLGDGFRFSPAAGRLSVSPDTHVAQGMAQLCCELLGPPDAKP